MIDGVRIAFIVAAAENGIIGRDGQLPWRLPSDLRYFRKLTMGKPVLMGRKTYLSIGKPLDGRDNIVLTRRGDFSAPGIHIAASTDDAIAKAVSCAKARGVDEIQVIGGAEVYRTLLPFADRLYLTRVSASPEGDATFVFDAHEWTEVAREQMVRTEKDAHDAVFITLDRRRLPS